MNPKWLHEDCGGGCMECSRKMMPDLDFITCGDPCASCFQVPGIGIRSTHNKGEEDDQHDDDGNSSTSSASLTTIYCVPCYRRQREEGSKTKKKEQ
jgi:hypothetical protein